MENGIVGDMCTVAALRCAGTSLTRTRMQEDPSTNQMSKPCSASNQKGEEDVDREVEDIIRRLQDLRSRIPADQLPAVDEMLLRAINADTPVERMQILDMLADPEGTLTRAEKDKIIAAATGDELAPRRIRRPKRQRPR